VTTTPRLFTGLSPWIKGLTRRRLDFKVKFTITKPYIIDGVYKKAGIVTETFSIIVWGSGLIMEYTSRGIHNGKGFRHFRASQWVMRGIDLRTVQELLGHRDIMTTMRYAHFAPNHAAKSILAAHRAEMEELSKKPLP
jgi:integrase